MHRLGSTQYPSRLWLSQRHSIPGQHRPPPGQSPHVCGCVLLPAGLQSVGRGLQTYGGLFFFASWQLVPGQHVSLVPKLAGRQVLHCLVQVCRHKTEQCDYVSATVACVCKCFLCYAMWLGGRSPTAWCTSAGHEQNKTMVFRVSSFASWQLMPGQQLSLVLKVAERHVLHCLVQVCRQQTKQCGYMSAAVAACVCRGSVRHLVEASEKK